MKKLVGAFLLATAVATPAAAGDSPLYIGAEVGPDHIGVLGGFKITDMFAVEMNYNQFDDTGLSMPFVSVDVDAWGIGLFGVGNFPIAPVPGLSVFGKAGFERVEVETSTTTTWSTFDYVNWAWVDGTTTTSATSSDIKFAGSVGAQYQITRDFSVRGGVHVKGHADSLFANAIYQF
jgi:opacity protein-like surface antigen